MKLREGQRTRSAKQRETTEADATMLGREKKTPVTGSEARLKKSERLDREDISMDSMDRCVLQRRALTFTVDQGQ